MLFSVSSDYEGREECMRNYDVTLTVEELKNLRHLLNGMELQEDILKH